VEAGISAGGEWIWELRTERALVLVGCAGRLRRYPERGRVLPGSAGPGI